MVFSNFLGDGYSLSGAKRVHGGFGTAVDKATVGMASFLFCDMQKYAVNHILSGYSRVY
jgi:hypothetical protein